MSVDLLDILSNCNGITNDSRKVKLGWLFLAYPGRYEDRRKYIPDAIKNGAKYILYEPRNYSVDSKAINFIPVKNLKEKISNIASDYYNHPSKKIEIIGVTGTNGKTTVTGWLDQSFRYLKKPSAWIGTLGFGDGENIKISNNTTPDAILIQEILSDYASKKYSFVTMEVSSHAIEQKRVEGVNFSAKLLTNVSRDHLDYHVTLKDYQEIKKSFFQSNKAKFFVINADDKIGQKVIRDQKKFIKIITYALKNNADLVATNIVYGNKTSFDLLFQEQKYEVTCNFFGKHNIQNVLLVMATLIGYHFKVDQIIECIRLLKSVPGRLERIDSNSKNKLNIFIDYAHTPHALENALLAIKETYSKKIILVFGCGGDRDHGKRAEMGSVANKLADEIIITSDNPRSENPKKIMMDIATDIRKPFKMIEDRGQAIRMAIHNMNEESILLIAGKGHEQYQEIDGKKIPFSDRDIVLKTLKNND